MGDETSLVRTSDRTVESRALSDPSSHLPSHRVQLSPGAERLAILALASGAFVMALNANVMAPLLPYLKSDPVLAEVLRTDDSLAGRLVGAAGLAGAIGALLLGPLVDKLGRRPPMFFGMFVFSVCSLFHVFAAGYDQLLLARAATGFAGGVVYASASAAVADLIPYERRGKAMGVFTAGMFLAIPAGLPAATLLARFGDWRWIYYVQFAIGLMSMLAIRIYLPAHLGKGHAFRENLPKLFTVEVFAALASVTLYVGAFFTSVQFAGDWLNETKLLVKEDQAVVWLVLGLCFPLGSMFLARLSDRMGKRAWTNLTTVLVALLLLGLTQVDGAETLLLVGIPLSIVSAARSGPFQALISELVPTGTRGTLMGIRSACVNLGTGLFPMIALKEYDDTLFLASGSIFVAFLLVQFLVKKR